jgi:hypothetical protein
MIERGWALPNAVNLYHVHILNPQWKVKQALKRIELVQRFYDYAHDGFADAGESFESFNNNQRHTQTK